MIVYVKTIFSLGLMNVFRVLFYRYVTKKLIALQHKAPSETIRGPFFLAPKDSRPDIPGSENWVKEQVLFGAHHFPSSQEPPDWFFNPIQSKRLAYSDLNWWEIPDFSDDSGDIKVIWEFSRFDWAFSFAQCSEIDRLNTWLSDWIQKNPPYKGPNWKCAQECSIRIMNLAMTAVILKQSENSCAGLLELVRTHLKRIDQTFSYALAQDNNHGTSEAAGLYIGGSWLYKELGDSQSYRWFKKGEKYLEERVRRLVMNDGSFSQYSVNYHRMLLDTLSTVEIWRSRNELKDFSTSFYKSAERACLWLHSFVDPNNGDAANIGANDGARLLALTQADYRDYRPSVHLAGNLFFSQSFYPHHPDSQNLLKWLGIPFSKESPPALDNEELFESGGFAILRNERTSVFIRFPNFKFRPSESDALHVDLWVDGINVLRDAGSYSYQAEGELQNYFPCTRSHNTVEFDGKSQMPRLSRFLFGDWIKYKDLSIAPGEFSCKIKTSFGASHKRSVKLHENRIVIEDDIADFEEKAILNWRLLNSDWKRDGTSFLDDNYRLDVDVEKADKGKQVRLGEAVESRYYLQKNKIPSIEVELKEQARIKTTFHWS